MKTFLSTVAATVLGVTLLSAPAGAATEPPRLNKIGCSPKIVDVEHKVKKVRTKKVRYDVRSVAYSVGPIMDGRRYIGPGPDTGTLAKVKAKTVTRGSATVASIVTIKACGKAAKSYKVVGAAVSRDVIYASAYGHGATKRAARADAKKQIVARATERHRAALVRDAKTDAIRIAQLRASLDVSVVS